MRTLSRVASLVLLSAVAVGAAESQDRRVIVTPDGGHRVMVIADDRPMIGVTTAAESERADTLGLRITDVQEDSPAAKAGLKAGDRLQSINGLNLRADRADAGESDYDGVLNRRLQRAVQETKEGATLELRVLSGGATRTVTVTPVPGRELMRSRGEFTMTPRGGMVERMAERAVLGLVVSSTGSIRDTAGVFVQSVSRDGPAEKAGIIEGDRIASINGVSLKVSREDAEDREVSSTRTERLARELAKLKVGDAADLVVVSGGRSRSVRVTTVRSSELLDHERMTFDFGAPGGTLRLRRPDGGDAPEVFFRRFEGELPLEFRRFQDGEFRQKLEELLPKVREMRRGRVIIT